VPRVRLVELSHPIEHGMAVYPGLPRPEITAPVDRAGAPGETGPAGFRLSRIEMAGNTGTYLDAPRHRFRDGVDLASLPLERLVALPGLVVDAGPGAGAIELPRDTAAWQGRAVLIRTGWDARWGTPAYWEPGPFVAGSGLERLVAAGPALVGVDFWNIDDTRDPLRPAHTALLGEGIPIVEHLCRLEALPAEGFRFSAAPLALVGGASSPVRAWAELPGL
jgi:kynurenine formamidase